MDDAVEQTVINAANEQAAIRLYAEIATNPDIGANLYTELEDLVETSINQDDMILAMGIKSRISKLLLTLIQSEHTRTRANMLRKFFNLDTRVTLFLLKALREQHSGITFSEEDNLHDETENSN